MQAVAVDMNTAYEQEVRAWCPNAEIVYDLFHVVAKYGREVIDRVRVDDADRLRHDKKARKVVKSARWLLLRNRENLPSRKQPQLMTVYVLKDDLKHLWDYQSEGWARRFWDQSHEPE